MCGTHRVSLFARILAHVNWKLRVQTLSFPAKEVWNLEVKWLMSFGFIGKGKTLMLLAMKLPLVTPVASVVDLEGEGSLRQGWGRFAVPP